MDGLQTLLADIADNVAAVVDEELDVVLLHQARLVLAVAAEEPALLWKPLCDAGGPQTLAGQVLGLLAAERQEIDRVRLCETAEARQSIRQPSRLGRVICRTAISAETALQKNTADVRSDLSERHKERSDD